MVQNCKILYMAHRVRFLLEVYTRLTTKVDRMRYTKWEGGEGRRGRKGTEQEKPVSPGVWEGKTSRGIFLRGSVGLAAVLPAWSCSYSCSREE